MAHEIDISAGYAAAAYARKPAWHGLGKVLPDLMTPEEAIEAAGIGWAVECQPVYRQLPNGEYGLIDDRRITVRMDTQGILGHVGTQFKPLQQTEQVDFLRGVVGNGCKIDACGSLRDGKRIWFLCDLRASYDVLPNDEVKPYLLTLNGHDGKLAWFAMLTSERVVCSNILALAMQKAGLDSNGNQSSALRDCVKLRHNGRLSDNIEQAKLALGIAKTAAEKQAEQAKALAAKQMNTSDLSKFFVEQVEALKLTKERNQAILLELAMALDSETNSLPGMRGTAWQAFNVWGEWLDHSARRVNPGVRMESLWVGDGARTKAKAWETLLQTAI
jgi:phage/plasmid-like protein (TIGR03299 family)